jgi:hypothetical protein
MMAGIDIQVDGRPVRYFFADEALSEEDEKAIGFDFTDDRELRDMPHVRRVLTTLIRPEPKIYGALHWSDGSDLAELDRKIELGTATDDDFAGALLGQPMSITCPNCNAQLRVLAVDGGQAIFGRTLAERLRSHEIKRSCPECKTELRMNILEFLGNTDA